MPIRRISQQVSNSLTSSSSVFSPVSVVKELIDNALDASATRVQIEVDVESGGLQHVSVGDNGEGVSANDRPLMCMKSTTSKIRTVEDIEATSSLGFRGEALFFLTQVASKGSMEITTRTKDDITGEKWSVNEAGLPRGGRPKPVATTIGTTVTLAGLFKATPVRRNLLKKKSRATIEKIKTLITSYAVTFRDVRFELKLVKVSTTGKLTSVPEDGLLLTPGLSVKALFQSLYKLKNFSQEFYEGEVELFLNGTGMISVRYVLPKMRAEDAVNVRKAFRSLSINSRPLSPNLSLGKSLRKVLNEIYASLLLLTPPVWSLEIHCPRTLVDVNIEPEKTDALLSNCEEFLREFRTQMEEVVMHHHGICSEMAGSHGRSAAEDVNLPMLSQEQDQGKEKEPHHQAYNQRQLSISPAAENINPETSPILLQSLSETDLTRKERCSSRNHDQSDNEPSEVVHPHEALSVNIETSAHLHENELRDSQHQPQQLSSSAASPHQHSILSLALTGAEEQSRAPSPRTRKVHTHHGNPKQLKNLIENAQGLELTATNVHDSNGDNTSSQAEVAWLLRKGVPSFNVLEGYLRLSQLTSKDGITSLDDIKVTKTRAWIKLS